MGNNAEQWSKALTLVLRKLGIVEMLITQADIDSIQALDEKKRPCPVVWQEDDGIHVMVVAAEDVPQERLVTSLNG